MQQSDRLLHIRLLPQVKTDPACLGQNMMRLCASCGDDLIAHFLRKGDIHQLVAMEVPDLAFAEHDHIRARLETLDRVDQLTVRGLNVSSLGDTTLLGNSAGGTVATYLGDIPLYVDLKMIDVLPPW